MPACFKVAIGGNLLNKVRQIKGLSLRQLRPALDSRQRQELPDHFVQSFGFHANAIDVLRHFLGRSMFQ